MTMKVSKNVNTLLMADAAERAEAAIAPYRQLAISLATGLASAKMQVDKVKGTKSTVWGGFKSALSIAATSGHTVTSLRIGLELACAEADIPTGSFRSYVGTVGNLYEDITEGRMTLAEAEAISIGDARKKYKPEPEKTDEQKAREELAAATHNWSAEQLRLLVAIAADTVETAGADVASDEVASEQQEAA